MSDVPIDDWRAVQNALHTRFRTGSFAVGLRLVHLIGEAAEAANHHPDLDLRYTHLDVHLFSHDAGAITDRDLSLARRISELAAGEGVSAEPAAVTVLELCLDTPDLERVKPFWRAILGYTDNPRAADEVRDGAGHGPALWFQPSGSDDPRQRFHLDVCVPPEVAQERIAAVVAAGGQVVDEQPTFVVLADADGNRACVCF